VNRQAQAVVMMLVGGAALRASLTGQYLRYVKPGLQPFLIVAGGLLLAAAAATLWYELRPATKGRHAATDHVHEGHVDDGHGHHREPWVAWLLVLPVFALLLVAPPALLEFGLLLGLELRRSAKQGRERPLSHARPLTACHGRGPPWPAGGTNAPPRRPGRT
jgi:hypothetical protein